MEFITDDELLAEDPDNIFVMGMAFYTEEDGDNIKVKILPDGPRYPLSKKELDGLWDYIREMEDNGKIRRSSKPRGAPILFVPKPDGTLWSL